MVHSGRAGTNFHSKWKYLFLLSQIQKLNTKVSLVEPERKRFRIFERIKKSEGETETKNPHQVIQSV